MTPVTGTLYRQAIDDDIADEELLEIEVAAYERDNQLGLPELSLAMGGNGLILKSTLSGSIITTDITYQDNQFMVTAAFHARATASALILGMWPGYQQAAVYDVSVPLDGAIVRHALPARQVLRSMLENLPDQPWVRISPDDSDEDYFMNASRYNPVAFDPSECYVYGAQPVEAAGRMTLDKQVALRGVFRVDNGAEYIKIDASGIYRSPSAPHFDTVTLPNALKTVKLMTPHIADSVYIREGTFLAVKPGYEGIAAQPYDLAVLREIAHAQYPDSPDPLYWLFGLSELETPRLSSQVHRYMAENRRYVPYPDFMSKYAAAVHQAVYAVSSLKAEAYAHTLIIQNVFANGARAIQPVVSGILEVADYLREQE